MLTPEEIEARRDAVRQAIASTRLERGDVCEQAQHVLDAWARGEISDAQRADAMRTIALAGLPARSDA